MLHQFLTQNRDALVERCRRKASARYTPTMAVAPVDHGVPVFLEQLVQILRNEALKRELDRFDPPPARKSTAIGCMAGEHGVELLRLGFDFDHVVHEYGDVCQSITELAIELRVPITTDEFRTLNRCLDDAIAGAVSSFGQARQDLSADEVRKLQSSIVDFTDEQRRLVDIAMKAFTAIKGGNVGAAGATGTLLEQALAELAHMSGLAVEGLGAAVPARPQATRIPRTS